MQPVFFGLLLIVILLPIMVMAFAQPFYLTNKAQTYTVSANGTAVTLERGDEGFNKLDRLTKAAFNSATFALFENITSALSFFPRRSNV